MTDWTELSVPSTSSRLLNLNSNQLFAASTISTEGIYKYDFTQRKWKLWKKYPENNNLQICPYLISSIFLLNRTANKLFLMGDYHTDLYYQPFHIINIDTIQYNKQNHEKNQPFCYHNLFKHWCMIYPSITNPNHHLIIPIALVYEKEEELTYADGDKLYTQRFKNQNIIYIPSQNRLLAFGGHYVDYGTQSVNCIWSYLLNTDNTDPTENTDNTDHYKWQRIGKLPKRQEDLQTVITFDEKFVIIFGGVVGSAGSMMELGDKIINDRIDDIYVLNVETMKLGISEIKSPLRTGEYRSGCIVNNKVCSLMLINGYCRSINIINIIPVDVVNIISLYYVMEYFHISDGESHFQIPLSEILDKTKKYKSI